MSLYPCPVHGEVALYPYASKQLSEQLNSPETSIVDVHEIKVEFFDGDELIQRSSFFFLKRELSELPTYLVIRNEQDEKDLLGNLLPKFKGGGCCPKCLNRLLVKDRA
ncbi:hypothetical protein QWY20_04070 [Alkalimonas sp. MEB108]|uniref:Uncharacterized protein n=1 Tax=Alkalimonas cellulosilytica TaxID=3058395 RepID=A0ABU7J2I8_9GAMM|nr:hypothetical protein [Alkalimonas sp. MEB108]MEE2000619.1 hypothetical protein [Alkalimonas sp. MEB108]